ncbi:glyoxylate reductase [Novosphingobium chloroacetimidivorans]|uniref:Glyoxylate reductase n=1 Tax=Novosphingobium chloroacetimidivorans TaxID=1428314 RepID=A0A7W7K6F0_9SPHN|nr:D-glycerate dehydrogenase [Novosphingobium chloroacetimidivorans]MBB4857114.1 glyoxylate reductase [Novosphingobium chloroacetimidivorans]
MNADTTQPNTPPPVARKPRVIVTRRLLPAIEARMQDLFDVQFNPDDKPLSREELAAAMDACDVLVPTVTDRLDAALIASAGERLKLIAQFGAGTDNIDVAAAHARRILVSNTPGVFTDDTADLTLALIIFVARGFAESARVLGEGGWEGWSPTSLLGHNLVGKRLGIVGMGRIGQGVARRARAFGLEIAYHNRNRLPVELEAELAAHYQPELDALVAQSDILTLHCPALPGGEALLDHRRLALMKDGALLINTARGQLVDEEALIESLRGGRLGGAGLDVFAGEPHLDPRLLAFPNVLVLPHLGSATREGREAAGERVIANIRSWADGHRLPDRVLPPT